MRALRRAIAGGELVMHYQPQVRLADGVVMGTEALVRWNHPQAGLLPPLSFLPAAEALGMVSEIDDFALCRALDDFAGGHLPGGEVSVNCSAAAVDARTPGRVSRALRRSGVPPAALVLEITETTTLRSTPMVDRALADITGTGVALAMDDFGAGSGRMCTLIDIPYARLKIDRSVTHQMVARNAVRASVFVRGLVDLTASMGVALSAEGVETTEQASAARAAGVVLAQGFLFGRPAPVSAAGRA